MNRGAYDWNRKSSSKQVTVVLIKIRCAFTNQIYFNTYMREAFIWGAYNRMIVFVYRKMGLRLGGLVREGTYKWWGS